MCVVVCIHVHVSGHDVYMNGGTCLLWNVYHATVATGGLGRILDARDGD